MFLWSQWFCYVENSFHISKYNKIHIKSAIFYHSKRIYDWYDMIFLYLKCLYSIAKSLQNRFFWQTKKKKYVTKKIFEGFIPLCFVLSFWMEKLTKNFEVDFSSRRTAHLIVSSADINAGVMTGHILNDDRVTICRCFTRG